MIEIPPEVVRSTITEIESQLIDPARTDESKRILTCVERTLQWVLAGAKGPLLNLNVVLCSEQILQRPNTLSDPGHSGSTTDRVVNSAEIVVGEVQSVCRF